MVYLLVISPVIEVIHVFHNFYAVDINGILNHQQMGLRPEANGEMRKLYLIRDGVGDAKSFNLRCQLPLPKTYFDKYC